MTRAVYLGALRAATAPGRMDIVRVLVPTVDGLPERAAIVAVLDAWRDPDVTAVVLHKGARA